ncbi:MAG: agmatinase [Candidatus Freyarchaeota archaeon]|nr:agmatinase [Candidatus Jordarchaeia archaeon]
MGYRSLYVTAKESFLGCSKSYGEALVVIIGVPFDATSTYKPGARFAPSSLREASWNMESFSIKRMLDACSLRFCDIGDLDVVPGDVNQTLQRLKLVVSEVTNDGKKPLILGGEHTLTLSAVECLRDIGVIQFDAHMDLRDDYACQRICHATVARRICEAGIPLIQVGVRACSRDEYDYTKESGVALVPAHEVHRSLSDAASRIRDFQEEHGRIYVSVDLDVLDPAFAPEVGNPEPGGLTTVELLSLIEECRNVAGGDVVELVPSGGFTAFTAARIAIELMFQMQLD